MTTKNPIRRFPRCKKFGMVECCNYFEWIDDAPCDKLRSMMVALMKKNDTLGNEIQKLQKIREERKANKESVQLLKEKNRRPKLQLNGYQMRERLILWGIIVFVIVVVVVKRAGRK